MHIVEKWGSDNLKAIQCISTAVLQIGTVTTAYQDHYLQSALLFQVDQQQSGLHQ